MNLSRFDRRLILGLIGLALVAMFLRFNRLSVWPLSLDESYSAYGASKGFAFIWHVLPGYETHPPFYTALLRCWTLVAGSSLLDLRMLGSLVGLITLPIVWFAAREAALLARRDTRIVPLCAVAYTSVHLSLVDLSRFVRPYSMMILVYAVAIWALIRLARLHREHGELATIPWIVYLFSLTLTIWLHNLGSLFVFTLVLAFVVLIGPMPIVRRHARAFILGHGLAFLAALPALLILMDQAPTWTHSTWLGFVPALLPTHLMMIFGTPGWYGALGVLLLVGLGLKAVGEDARGLGLALVISTILPILLSIVISVTVAPVFLVRTLVGCCIPLSLLVALGANEGLWPRTGLAMIAVVSAIRIFQVQHLPPDQDWYAAVRWLAPRVKPTDIVYAYPNEGALPLRRALSDLRTNIPVRTIPGEVPARDPAGRYTTGNRGVQLLPRWRMAQIASDPISRKTPTIWLFRLGKRPYDLDDIAEKTFREGRIETGHFELRAIDIVGLAKPANAAPTQ